jgi:hypothetical protein
LQSQNEKSISLKAALEHIHQKENIDILYEDKLINGLYVSAKIFEKEINVEEKLKAILSINRFTLQKLSNSNYVIIKKFQDTIPIKKKKENSLRIEEVRQNSKYTIHGYIEDSLSGEKLISAAIYSITNGVGTVSNTYGFYSLTLPSGQVSIRISYVGYQTRIIDFNLNKDTTLNLGLKEGATLQEVVIIGNQESIQSRTQMSQISVPIEQIKKVPALMGEVDVLKVLQLLPGVQGGNEGQNGLYVRGGSPDQNLILLDGVPVYNVSHIGGFFSVFNADAIKNVTLTTGGFPARFGGRLSSVIEIDMKEGNMKEFHGEGGIGLIASRLTLEGPILKDKISFIVSGRRTYLDLLAEPFITKALKKDNATPGYNTTADLRAHFYDLNAKINWRINQNHRIYLSLYNGQDIFGLRLNQTQKKGIGFENTNGGLDWGNYTSALRWNWLLNKKLFANTTLTYSKYKVDVGAETESKKDTTYEAFRSKYLSGIRDIGIKIDFNYALNPAHQIRFGANVVHHTYSPGALQLKSESQHDVQSLLVGPKDIKSIETQTYVEDDMQYGALKLNAGLHFSSFHVQQQNYFSLQPRLGINYLLSQSQSLKASFTTMRQYINLLTNERIGLPTDLWVPSTARIKPQDAWQVAVGTAKTLARDYELSIEAFYKKMNHLISYKDGASFLSLNTDWEDRITQGKGKSYGTEFLLQKKNGNTTGWIGYTLAWNYRQFTDINQGAEYAYKYDRRHDIEILVSHKFTKRFAISGTWQYGTGNAISLPQAIYKYPSDATGPLGYPSGNQSYYNTYEIIGTKNAYRMPPYHRMDINFEWTKEKKRYTRTWNLGAYNLYNRANPYYLSLGTKYDVVKNESSRVVRQVSIFPIVPYFSYNFKF